MHPFSHLTYCTPTKSNLYLVKYLDAGVIEPDLYMFLTFQVPNLKYHFRCLVCTKIIVQVQGFVCEYFVTGYVYTAGPSGRAV